MAAAEARAAWQRTVNRCLVQEDAKRTPKLACCPSASPLAREVDVGPQSDTDVQNIPSVVFLPCNWSTSYYNLSPNSRWWLQSQPSYSQQKGLSNQQYNSEESEMKFSQSGLGSAVKCPEVESEDNSAFVGDSMNTQSSNLKVKNDIGNEKSDFKPVCKESLFESAKISTNGSAVSKKAEELFPFSESPWIRDEKTEPWWRIADEDELALFVAQRSFGFIENCDLPQPRNSSVKRQAFVDLCPDDHKKTGIISLIEPKQPAHCRGMCNCNQNSIAPEGELQKPWLPVDCSLQSSTITSLREGVDQGAPPRRTMEQSDSCKAELLDALRHSQTRAREAEKVAKQAYEEKEHLVKLVFRQASQLFAYRQWFQLLQLENLCNQIKNSKNQPISSLFPASSPWMPLKPKRLRKNWQKGSRGKQDKRGRPGCNICKYAVVFALGLSLVGAGLLLGWTVGWMLPTF